MNKVEQTPVGADSVVPIQDESDFFFFPKKLDKMFEFSYTVAAVVVVVFGLKPWSYNYEIRILP